MSELLLSLVQLLSYSDSLPRRQNFRYEISRQYIIQVAECHLYFFSNNERIRNVIYHS